MDIFEIFRYDFTMQPGPDPKFPYLNENERFQFPHPEKSANNSIIAWGGNLSPGMLLSAYEQGLFPWYNEGDPILWQSPDPRFVIFPEKLHISKSMTKILKQKKFDIAFDGDFESVIRGCSEMRRPGQNGTWITNDIISAYTELHKLGWAHSSESWSSGKPDDMSVRERTDSGLESRFDGYKLAGGCYGIRLGNVFFGESMFSLEPNASKAAFLTLALHLFNDGVEIIDCQTPTYHLESLGGEKIPRKDFIRRLRTAMADRDSDLADRRGKWNIKTAESGNI